MMLKKTITIIFLLFSVTFSQTKYGGAFLELGVGARALGMGSAQVAVSEDAYGAYWNPGGIAFVNNFQTASMYATLFSNLENQSYISAVMPLFGGVSVSASWIRLSVEDIPRYLITKTESQLVEERSERITGTRDQLVWGNDGYFSSSSNAYIFTFAKYHRLMVDLGWQYFEFPIDFAYGANLKVIQENIDNKSGNGVGLDIGLVTRIGLNNIFNNENYGNLSFGLNVQDIANTQIKWNTTNNQKDQIERNFKYGFAYSQPLLSIKSQLLFALDLDSRYEGTSHLGVEYLYNSLLAFRLGSTGGYFTAGAGLYIWKLQFDYAYQSHDLGNTHRVSVLFHL